MSELIIGPLSSSPLISRHPLNPILSPGDVPYGPAMVFNAGVTKFKGKYVMVFRNDYGDEAKQLVAPHHTTNLGLAFSDDGIKWEVQPEPCWSWQDEEVTRVYDPRLTVIGERCYMCFAVDTKHGLRGGIAVTDDFRSFEVLSLSLPDNRNMVLFPEQIGGKYIRLERPLPVYSRGGIDRFDMWMSDSPDLKYWGTRGCCWRLKMWLMPMTRSARVRRLSRRTKAGLPRTMRWILTAAGVKTAGKTAGRSVTPRALCCWTCRTPGRLSAVLPRRCCHRRPLTKSAGDFATTLFSPAG